MRNVTIVGAATLGLLVGGTFPGAYAVRASPQGPRQTVWEFASLELDRDTHGERVIVCRFQGADCKDVEPEGTSITVKPQYVGAVILHPRVMSALAKLGAEGWELVDVGPTGRCEACSRFYLKREVASQK